MSEKPIYVFLKSKTNEHELIGQIDYQPKMKKGDNEKYNFTYLSDESIVSLSDWGDEEGNIISNGRLHPFLETSMPEGMKLELLNKKYKKLLPENKAHLLTLSGVNNIGAFCFSYDKESPSSPDIYDSPNIEQFKDGGIELFKKVFEQFNELDGIGGVQPKTLAFDEEAAAHRTWIDKDYIVKSESAEYPFLSVVEYLSMKCAENSGIEIPEIQLSEDQKLLLVKRFDFDDNKNPLVLEESSSLNDMGNENKYQGTYSQFSENIKEYSCDETQDLEAYFKIMVLNNLIKNGDAHHKNFALLYDPKNSVNTAKMSPAYDIVSTAIYEPDDIPALALSYDNLVKRWVSTEELIEFGQSYCDLDKNRAIDLISDVISGVQKTIEIIPEFKNNENEKLLGQLESLFETEVKKSLDELTNISDLTANRKKIIDFKISEIEQNQNNQYTSETPGLQ